MLPSYSVCFVCLKTDEILIKVVKGSTYVFKQAQYVIPELDQLKPGTELRICTSCHDSLVAFYKYKKKCVSNINRLKTYYVLTTPDGREHQIKQESIIQATNNVIEDIQIESSIESSNTTPSIEEPSPSVPKIDSRIEIRVSDVSSSDEEELEIDTMDVETFKKKDFIRNECFTCIKKFYTEVELKLHMKKHDGEHYTCTKCNTIFLQENHMLNHITIHNTNRNFRCKECDKTIVTKQHFEEHIQTHYCEKQHKCSICDKKFISKRILHQHFLLHAKSIYKSK